MHIYDNYFMMIIGFRMRKMFRIKVREKLKTRFMFSTVVFTKYEGWNFNSGNYLFTTDTK